MVAQGWGAINSLAASVYLQLSLHDNSTNNLERKKKEASESHNLHIELLSDLAKEDLRQARHSWKQYSGRFVVFCWLCLLENRL